MNALFAAALDYADRGWAVVPLHTVRDGRCSCRNADCPSPGKHPRTRVDATDASADSLDVEQWWARWPDANVGLATGLPGGFDVLSVAPDGAGTLEEYEPLPPTLAVLTGGGGAHYLFAHAEEPLRGSLGPGVDVKSAGGYIVAPPSLHASGARYEWNRPDNTSKAVANWPDALRVAVGRVAEVGPLSGGLRVRDTAEAVELVQRFLARFIVLRDSDQAVAVALWVLHAHAIDAAETTPYLAVLSAEKRSGKSRVLELLEALTPHALHVSNISEAGLYQALGQKRRTLLIDEIDALFGQGSERTEGVRGIVNAGNRITGTVLRGSMEGEPQEISVFGAKVLAGIDTGSLPDTVRDRCIPVVMRRKRPDEKVERLLWRRVRADADELRATLTAWGRANGAVLQDAYPDIPEELDDRAADGWEPLFAIADLAGAEWGETARAAAVALSQDALTTRESSGIRLLTGLHRVFGDRTKVFTVDLLAGLNALDDERWSGWNKGEGIKAHDLATRLRAYEVRPRDVKIDDRVAKGYQRRDFEDAWDRYLSHTDPPGRGPTCATRPTSAGGDDVLIDRAKEMFPGSVEVATACACPPSTTIRDDRYTGCGASKPAPF